MNKSRFSFIFILLVLAILLTACSGDSTADEIKIGNPAPGFALSASDGSTVSLSDYQGQPILLFFHMAGG